MVLAGDAAGVVAPASGEGIYYAMLGGRLAADAVEDFLATGDAARAAPAPASRFMKAHGRVFWILGIMQRFWYSSDKRRERFVSICRDRDVQQLTLDSYMNKELVRTRPMAHVRIFFKDMAHLLGLVSRVIAELALAAGSGRRRRGGRRARRLGAIRDRSRALVSSAESSRPGSRRTGCSARPGR